MNNDEQWKLILDKIDSVKKDVLERVDDVREDVKDICQDISDMKKTLNKVEVLVDVQGVDTNKIEDRLVKVEKTSVVLENNNLPDRVNDLEKDSSTKKGIFITISAISGAAVASFFNWILGKG